MVSKPLKKFQIHHTLIESNHHQRSQNNSSLPQFGKSVRNLKNEENKMERNQQMMIQEN